MSDNFEDITQAYFEGYKRALQDLKEAAANNMAFWDDGELERMIDAAIDNAIGESGQEEESGTATAQD